MCYGVCSSVCASARARVCVKHGHKKCSYLHKKGHCNAARRALFFLRIRLVCSRIIQKFKYYAKYFHLIQICTICIIVVTDAVQIQTLTLHTLRQTNTSDMAIRTLFEVLKFHPDTCRMLCRCSELRNRNYFFVLSSRCIY
jgi:hypothetical protein